MNRWDDLDGIPDHLYHDSCPGTCCGGDEPSGRPESSALSVFGPVAAGLVQQAPSQPSQVCGNGPGGQGPDCDFDPSCPTHGILGNQP